MGTSTVPLADLLASNQLQSDGNQPFHLRLSFQVFDMQGGPSEKGTLDYWWAGPERTYLEVTAPSVGTVHDLNANAIKDVNGARTLYLADELLGWMRSPGRELGRELDKVQMTERVFAGAVLECLQREVPPEDKGAPVSTSATCTDQQTGTVRLIESPTTTVVRNRTGTFGKTHVALSVSVSLYGKRAIEGTVDALQAFKPEAAPVKLSTPAMPAAGAGSPVQVAGGVVAGHKLSGPQPDYPLAARSRRSSGTVILVATISETGTVENPFPLLSPDPQLTQASMDAVRQWKYQPYLLNGSPVRVTTRITLNFSLSGHP